MKDREYKDAWYKLKDKKIEKFIQLHNLIINNYDEGDCLRYMEQKSELFIMDNADGTNEFSDLLNDMEDE